MPSFNEQEIRNIIAFLNRVDLKGTEAVTLALLQQKLQTSLVEQTKTKVEKEPAKDAAAPAPETPAAEPAK